MTETLPVMARRVALARLHDVTQAPPGDSCPSTIGSVL
jgi:hypothetical protein